MPDDSNNSNTRVSAMAPDASTSPVGHTPGPWATEVDGTAWRVLSGDGLVCEMPLGWSDGSPVGDERLGPDACLIAAAPELLAVAQMVVEASELAGFSGPLGNAAHAAIAKARGTTPTPEVSHVG